MLGTPRCKYAGKPSIGNELVGQFPIRKYNSDVVLDLDLKFQDFILLRVFIGIVKGLKPFHSFLKFCCLILNL